MSSVCAVVVTHNRQALLRRCLEAVAAQHRAPDRVLLIDNASTDGSAAMVRRELPDVEVVGLAQNVGGAGGFHEGLRRAHGLECEWIWLMDDDTIPQPSALAELLRAADRVREVVGGPEPMLLASRVLWRDGADHPLNFPTLERRRMDLVVEGAQQRVLPLRSATFVSLLVHGAAIDRFGLPYPEFFLWSDDIEYTSRIVLGGGGAYWVPDSVVLHDTVSAEDFRTARPERFYFHARNTLLIARAPGRPLRDRLLRAGMFCSTSAAYLLSQRSWRALLAVGRGLRDGLRGVPR